MNLGSTNGAYGQDAYYSQMPSQPPMAMNEGYSAAPPAAPTDAYSTYSTGDQETLETQWKRELVKTEEEIVTLRQVLTNKTQRVNELKKKLGVSVWSEMKTDLKVGFHSLTSSDPYQKSADGVPTLKEKTSGVFGFAGSKMSEKFSNLRNLTSLKSFEERVGSAVSSVKDRLTASRSEQNFEEALQEELQKREAAGYQQEVGGDMGGSGGYEVR